MDIKNQLSSSLMNTRLNQGPAPKTESKPDALGTGSEKHAGKTETVSLSSAQLGHLSASDAPVDMAKVEAIKQAISSGAYQIDAQKIADRLIATELTQDFGL